MKILLVYPEYPVTYWGFQYALKFISKKAGYPPLGLITVAAMLPDNYEKRLVDMNVTKLRDRDILWADCVFISAMVIQKKSAREVIERCKSLGVRIAAGGPLFTEEYEEFDDVDYLLLKEGELTVPSFIQDLEKGEPLHFYDTDQWSDLSTTPVPLWELLDITKYANMSIQYSRGCPFNCEFCNITSLYGHIPRTKDSTQLIRELDALYDLGWRGGVFFVDDNFIGNKKKLKEEILPSLIRWMEDKGYPFSFITETSINLADDDELMRMMVRGGFSSVFVGIETPNAESLAECGKMQNKNRDLVKCVKKMQNYGLHVHGGFIVGFDNDKDTIFDMMIDFIQESGIVTAMVGLLNAPKGSKLYQRLDREGRILKGFTGNNTDFSMNFIPRMDRTQLVKGYKSIVDSIYSPKKYYERIKTFLKEYKPEKHGSIHLKLEYVLAFFRSVIHLGIIGCERWYYWKLVFWSLFKHPRALPLAVTLSIYGFHFRKVFENAAFETS